MKRGPASQSSNCAKQKGKKKELNKDSADSFFLPEWRELTSDPHILKTIKGFNFEFVDRP